MWIILVNFFHCQPKKIQDEFWPGNSITKQWKKIIQFSYAKTNWLLTINLANFLADYFSFIVSCQVPKLDQTVSKNEKPFASVQSFSDSVGWRWEDCLCFLLLPIYEKRRILRVVWEILYLYLLGFSAVFFRQYCKTYHE